ncbi:chymotrypsin-like protease CTRL-1 [Cydia strobilella]|uniref:chymotrypsin-like protease CTRL-1 n=1 Tax=Cydia strobilella TaxID=1100964 RepID=UPI0030060247
MKETWLAIGFVTVLSLFALFSIIKFATGVGDPDEILSTPVEAVEVIELPVLRLTDTDFWIKCCCLINKNSSHRYPYLAAIIAQSGTNDTEGWIFTCFGSVITMRWIVTTAHCKIPDHTHRALLHRDYIYNHTNTRLILRWKVHPGFISNSTVPWHDIALVKVDKDMETAAPVFFTNGVQQVQASVWKTIITMDRRTYLTNAMEIYDVELVNPIFCYERYGFTLDDTLICVNMTHDADCFITEFGPIFTPTERVLGVLRLMPNDCDNKLAIFTNVTSYFEWISKETGAGKDRKEVLQPQEKTCRTSDLRRPTACMWLQQSSRC